MSPAAPAASRPRLRGLGAAIAAWGSSGGGRTRRDDLPWRATRDPWAVLVSEVMAQQTQLARVVPTYHRFLAAFPSPAACAAAPLGDVLRAWEGMGYNRRARDLQRAAAAVVADHGGRLPDDLDVLEDVVSRVLGSIERYDEQNGTDLLRSLDMYFRHDAQVAKTASALFIHNHTLAYRLRRIEEITSRRLKSLHDQTELWLALQAFAITRGGPPAGN